MTGFTANPDDLRTIAPQYDATARQAQEIYKTLTDALDTEGACWGNDDAGAAFGQWYVPVALNALQQMARLTKGLQSVADGVFSWARNFTDADEAVRQSASQISPDS